MKSNLLLILKGFAIGIGKIIPGASGAVLAMTLKVYEPALNAISNLRKDIYNNTKYLATLGIGILIAIIIGSKFIVFFLDTYHIQTICLFIGMMVSGTVPIFKEIKKTNLLDKLLFLIIFLVLIYLSNISLNKQLIKIESTWIATVLYFISGILDAFCSIVPGISGTAVLISFGTYYTILSALGSFHYLSNLIIIIPFFIGIVSGGYFISKIINHFFRRYRKKTFGIIISLSFWSIYSMLDLVLKNTYTITQALTAVIFLICGYIITKKMNI